MIQTIGIDRGDKIYFEEFELFFYQLFKEMDKKQEYLRLYYYQKNRVSSKIVKLKASSRKNNHKSNYGYNGSADNQCSLI